jgi:hypothetical protein
MRIRPRKGWSGGSRGSTKSGANGSATGTREELVLEGEIAVKVDFGLFHLPATLHAGFFVGAASPDIAEDAFAIELLFQAAKGLVDRFAALEPDFNHGINVAKKEKAGKGVFKPPGPTITVLEDR